MGEFWDARAREDSLFFVDDRLEYGAADAERFWAGGPAALDQILGALEVTVDAGQTVVEIGCGVGRITRPLAERARRVVALDVSGEMLALARRDNPALDNVEWLQGSGVDLAGVTNASADACFSHVVFQHIPDPRITLGYVREMGRVLKPGGWAAFQISNAPEVHDRTPGSAKRARLAVARRLGRAPHGTGDARWLGSAVDLGDLERSAADGALSVERVLHARTQFCLVLLRR